MAFYVPIGPRGIIFRFGTVLIGFFGSMVYRRAHRRRRREAGLTESITLTRPSTARRAD